MEGDENLPRGFYLPSILGLTANNQIKISFLNKLRCQQSKDFNFFYQFNLKQLTATVGAFVKENLDGMKCSNEFIEFILRVSREYISVIADEANKICLQEGKKTIAPYYIYQALKKYQLDSQISELEQAKQTFTEENHKAQNEMFKNPEMVQQLIKAQEQLFEQSRNKSEAEIQCLNVIESGADDYKKKDLTDLTIGPGGFGTGLLLQNKENVNKSNEMDDDDDEDDYEN